jgi:hypothetical protein
LKTKKILLFSALIIALNNVVLGQKTDTLVSNSSEKGFRSIAFTGGLSIPMENYHSNLDEQNFPAHTGYNFNLETSYQLKKKIYISTSIGSFINPLDKKKFKDSLSLPSMETMKYTASTKKWNNLYLLIGPSYEVLKTAKISIDIKFRIGMTYTVRPSFTKIYTSYYDINDLQISPSLSQPLINSTRDSIVNSTAVRSIAFAYSIGGAVSYTLTEKWALRLNTDLLFTNPKFGSNSNPMTVFNTTIGLAYKVGK